MLAFPCSWKRAWKGLDAGSQRGAAAPGRDGESVHDRSGDTLRDELLAHYAAPHRRYHTQQHLQECLALFNAWRRVIPHPAEVEMAIWFHDAIYDVPGKDNEARSADWAAQALLAAGVAAERVQRVRALVLATRHDVGDNIDVDTATAWLVDIDLAILGAAPARFAEYERQIREEYAYVPEPIFKDKRRALLQAFLERPQLYVTTELRTQFEAQARANLRQALAAD